MRHRTGCKRVYDYYVLGVDCKGTIMKLFGLFLLVLNLFCVFFNLRMVIKAWKLEAYIWAGLFTACILLCGWNVYWLGKDLI